MTRALIVGTLAAAAFAAPALAADTVQEAKAAFGAELVQAHQARQAQHILARQGYVAISELEQVAGGRWIGTAQKDGKTLIVGVTLPKPAVTVSN